MTTITEDIISAGLKSGIELCEHHDNQFIISFNNKIKICLTSDFKCGKIYTYSGLEVYSWDVENSVLTWITKRRLNKALKKEIIKKLIRMWLRWEEEILEVGWLMGNLEDSPL